ncbi:hypothetical protein C8R44DRAFT_981421 [Mycena epipterygia]|nr:hypothetical protein C8R44DRAFT_981421 [Mycena epipterygia]
MTLIFHGYTFDVAPTLLSRPLLFGVLDALSMIGFVIGAVIGKLSSNNIAYIFSIILALFNLVFISQHSPSAFSVFFRDAASRKYVPLLALAFYVFSLTSLYRILSVFALAAGLGIALHPAKHASNRLHPSTLNNTARTVIAWLFRRSYGDTQRTGLHFATMLAQNSILLATLSSSTLSLRSHPFTVGAGPALYALGAAYFVALGRRAEVGSLFGALATPQNPYGY